MADQVMSTANQVSVLVPEIWSQRFYDTLLAELPFNSVISRDYEGEIQNLGDTVKISTIPEFGEAEEISEDGRADADSVTVTQQLLVINRRVVKDFIITNKALLQSIPFVEKLQELAVYSVQKKIQQTIIANTIPSAAAPDHQIAYDNATTLTLADMLEAKELLDAADVPATDRHFVVGSAQLNDIFAITGFTSSDFLISGAPLQTGELSSALLGFQPHYTSVVGSTSYFFHSSYLTMAPQRGMNVQRYDLGVDGKRAERINIDMLYGLEQLGNDRVVTIG